MVIVISYSQPLLCRSVYIEFSLYLSYYRYLYITTNTNGPYLNLIIQRKRLIWVLNWALNWLFHIIWYWKYIWLMNSCNIILYCLLILWLTDYFLIIGAVLPLGQLRKNPKPTNYKSFRMPYKEYIVNDQSQVCLRYLVEFSGISPRC
jgi:hypothetical protein